MIEHHDQKGYLRFAINLGNPVLTTLLPDGAPGGSPSSWQINWRQRASAKRGL